MLTKLEKFNKNQEFKTIKNKSLKFSEIKLMRYENGILVWYNDIIV